MRGTWRQLQLKQFQGLLNLAATDFALMVRLDRIKLGLSQREEFVVFFVVFEARRKSPNLNEFRQTS